jgi:hypothetical protein
MRRHPCEKRREGEAETRDKDQGLRVAERGNLKAIFEVLTLSPIFPAQSFQVSD